MGDGPDHLSGSRRVRCHDEKFCLRSERSILCRDMAGGKTGDERGEVLSGEMRRCFCFEARDFFNLSSLPEN